MNIAGGNAKGERSKTGVSGLDEVLNGGFIPHRLYLLDGNPGAGKTTLSLQYLLEGVKAGEKCLYITLSETKEAGQVRVQQVDPAELSPGEFACLVRASVEQDKARVVVIDSLNGYMYAMPEEKYLTAQLHELLTYLGRQGVTTLLVVAQHGMVGTNMLSPVDTSYLADSVVLLCYFEYAGKVKKAISVVKKRSGAHEQSIRELQFDGKGIHLSEPLTQFRGILTGVPVESKSAENDAIREPRKL